MDLDEDEFEYIQELKNREKQNEEELLYENISKLGISGNQGQRLITSLDDRSACYNVENNPTEVETMSDYSYPPLPSVREASRVQFKHTPRAFKTPIRESTMAREMEFLVKNRPFLTKNRHFNNDGADPSEIDPTWLKKKGDDFFLGGDYLSAINAYSEAFEQDDRFYQSLMNRSLCHLKIGEIQLCIYDGEEALNIIRKLENESLLTSSESISLQTKILIRIASALCQMSGAGPNHYENALLKLQEAANLNKSDSLLSQGIEQMKVISEAMKLKMEGDTFLANDEIEVAITFYNKAILKDNSLLIAKVNCATAYLVTGAFEKCVALCGEVLDVLKMTGASKKTSAPSLIDTIPLPGTGKRRMIAITTLLKRAEANLALHKFEEVLQDFEATQGISCFVDDELDFASNIAEVKKMMIERFHG